jgi:ribonuclease R
LREAEAAKPATLAGREDWRELPLITIDPPDAKDHDDAVHARNRHRSEQQRRLYRHVAIADVAFYVRPGSALDREALTRGNSVYFPDRVVPMLPERISNDLCSLVPGEPRGALAVRMVIGADGRKRSHTFHRILMRSAAKLNYAQAQAAIDGRPDDTTGPLLGRCAQAALRRLCARQARARRARAARSRLPERKILLKPDGTVDRVIVPERLDAHKLIEEFMILANVAAAEMLEKKALPLIYRVHDEPTLEKLITCSEFLPDARSPFAKSGALRPQVQSRAGAGEGRRFRTAGQRSGVALAGAGRICRRELRPFRPEPAALRAFHLADPPLCRLDRASRADPRALGLAKARCRIRPTSRNSRNRAQISVTERRAMKAERETADRLIAHFLADRIGATFRGPHFRRHPRRPVRQAQRHRRRRLRSRPHHRR